MANENIVELIFQLKDLFSEGFSKVRASLQELPAISENISNASKKVNEGFSSLKDHWLAITATIIGAWQSIEKAVHLTEIGAQAEQTAEAFGNVTKSYGINGQTFLEELKKVSAGVIDETDLMARAMKGLQQGLSADQLVQILEIARVQARVAGTDISAAFDAITNAVANQMTRGLKLYGLVVDQSKAFEDYANKIGVATAALTEQQQSAALAAAVIEEGHRQMKTMGDVSMNTAEFIQMLGARWKDFKEEIGKALIEVGKSLGIFASLDDAITTIKNKFEEFKTSGELRNWGERIVTVVNSLVSVFMTFATVIKYILDAIGPFLPAIVNAYVALKTFQIGISALIGLPLAVAADVTKFAASLVSVIAPGESVIGMLGKLKTAMFENIGAANSLGGGIQASMAIAGLAIGFLVVEMLRARTEARNLAEAQKWSADQQEYANQKTNQFRDILSEVNAKLVQTEQDYKDNKISADEYNRSIHDLTIEKNLLIKSAQDSSAAFMYFHTAIHNNEVQMNNLTEAYKKGNTTQDEYKTKTEELSKAKEDLWEKFNKLTVAVKVMDIEEAKLANDFNNGKISSDQLAKGLEDLEGKKRKIIDASEGIVKAQEAERISYEDALAAVKEGSPQWVALKEKEMATSKAQVDYEIAQQKRLYDEGKISITEFLAFKIKRTQEEIDKEIALQEQMLKNELALPKLNLENIAAIQQKIEQLKIASAKNQITTEEELYKELQKEHLSAFDTWKNLQELKTQSLKANLDLQNAMDDAAVKAGTMRDSEAMANKLDRFISLTEFQIANAQQTADKIAELEAQGFYKTKEEQDKAQEEYRTAIAEKENLQLALQQNIITSEQQIAEAQKNEAIEAEKFIAGILDDRIRLSEISYQEQLDQLEKYHKQGLISETDYNDALREIERKTTSRFKAELQERSTQLNEMVDIIRARTEKMWSAVSGFFQVGYDDIKKYFGDAKEALAADLNDVSNNISNFLRQVNSGSYNLFWSATLFGRKMVEMVGTSIYDWARNVTDYINYVKGLMQSLREQIMSYQDQLDQLRGNEVAIIDRWYQTELAKLKEQYSGNLANTKEYYDAMNLLDQLYREKKKRAEEEEAANKAQLEQSKQPAEGEGAKGIIPIFPSYEDFVKQLQQNVALNIGTITDNLQASPASATLNKLEVNLDLEAPHYDPESTTRWVKDILWPILMHEFRLRGIDL